MDRAHVRGAPPRSSGLPAVFGRLGVLARPFHFHAVWRVSVTVPANLVLEHPAYSLVLEYPAYSLVLEYPAYSLVLEHCPRSTPCTSVRRMQRGGIPWRHVRSGGYISRAAQATGGAERIDYDPSVFPVNTHGGLLAFGAPWEVGLAPSASTLVTPCCVSAHGVPIA